MLLKVALIIKYLLFYFGNIYVKKYFVNTYYIYFFDFINLQPFNTAHFLYIFY